MESIGTGLRHIMCDLMKAQPPEEAVILAWPIVFAKDVAARTQAVALLREPNNITARRLTSLHGGLVSPLASAWRPRPNEL